MLPQESDILAGVLADMQAAFGGDLTVYDDNGNPILTTPVGQLASSETAIIGDKNDNMALVANMVDPAYASGKWQDAIGRIYFLTRNPAEPTTLQVVCVGAVGTVINIGAKVAGSDGNVYACTTAGTIPSGGSITLPFANVIAGAIPVPASVSIYQSVSGWDTVTLSSGVIGSPVESRADFEYRRQNSVAINAKGSLPSIYANVFAVPGVVDAYVYENTSSSSISVGSTSFSMSPKSLYVAVAGSGSQSAIALAIWNRKSCGADYNGNTSVTVQDTSGYSAPLPTYTVKYEAPTAVPILFSVEIAADGSLPSNINTLIQSAIISAFAGGDGGSRARIGSKILASRYYSPVAATYSTLQIVSILIGSDTATHTSVQMGIDQVPTISASNILVTQV